MALISEFSDGATELRDARFLRIGRVGVGSAVPFWLTVYSTRFNPKNSLILPNVVLLLIEGMNHDLWQQLHNSFGFRLVYVSIKFFSFVSVWLMLLVNLFQAISNVKQKERNETWF